MTQFDFDSRRVVGMVSFGMGAARNTTTAANLPAFPARRLVLGACFVWALAWLWIGVLVWRDPVNHNVCVEYATPSHNWLAGRGLYLDNMGVDGFLYMPQSGLLYMPFALMGPVLGGMVWRAAGLCLFCWGIWRWGKMLWPDIFPSIFAIASAIAFPITLASLRNGQANLQIAALMLLAAAELHQRRWWWATLWLVIGLVVKPIMIVMVLLAAAVYPVIIWRLAIVLVLATLIPFATQKPHYVLAQYQAYYEVLKTASQPQRIFCDLRGLLWKMGWIMPQSLYQAVQILAAGATLGLCLIASRRWAHAGRAFFLFILAACYLMLFNPRTESSSYVILGPALALPAAALLLHRDIWGWVVAALSICLSCDGWAYNATHNWLKPAACIVFLGLVIYQLLRGNAQRWNQIPRPPSGVAPLPGPALSAR